MPKTTYALGFDYEVGMTSQKLARFRRILVAALNKRIISSSPSPVLSIDYKHTDKGEEMYITLDELESGNPNGR